MDFIADNRVIFDVGGKKYRLIVRFSYRFKSCQIEFVGTHKEYDAVDPPHRGVQAMTREAQAGSPAPVANIRPIRNAADHRWALQEVDAYFAAEPEVGSPEGDRFAVLLALIGAYEAEHHPVPPADPIEILEYAIQDMGRSRAELAALLGSRARASEILNRRRPLSLAQIRTIGAAWHLPIACLAAPYRLVTNAA